MKLQGFEFACVIVVSNFIIQNVIFVNDNALVHILRFVYSLLFKANMWFNNL